MLTYSHLNLKHDSYKWSISTIPAAKFHYHRSRLRYSNMNRQKLLVIEPDADSAQLLDESLSAQGYDVRLTDSAAGAMLLLHYYEPDAVLLAQQGDEDRTL